MGLGSPGRGALQIKNKTEFGKFHVASCTRRYSSIGMYGCVKVLPGALKLNKVPTKSISCSWASSILKHSMLYLVVLSMLSFYVAVMGQLVSSTFVIMFMLLRSYIRNRMYHLTSQSFYDYFLNFNFN